MENRGNNEACIYLINAGKVRVYLENENKDKCEIKILGEGEVFGDLEFITGQENKIRF
jgi:CRP-like cAMP-binding protein